MTTVQGRSSPGAPSPSEQILRWFDYHHLPEHLQEISANLYATAHKMDLVLADGPEKTAGLRKLLEAKDCFVRAAISET